MKRVSLFLVAAMAFCTTYAQQFTNGNFESWSGNSPQGWNSLGYMGFNLCDINKSSDANGGNTAVRIAPKPLPSVIAAMVGADMVVPGFLTNATVNMQAIIDLFTSGGDEDTVFSPEVIMSLLQGGLSLNEQPTSISGYYKFDQKDAENDMFFLQALLVASEGDQKQIVGMSTFTSDPEMMKSEGYASFTMELVKLSETPATELIFIALVSGDENNTTADLSSLLLDDLTINYNTGLEKLDLTSQIAMYPNPCSGDFRLNAPAGSSVRITDALGRSVKNIESYDNGTISLENKGIYFVNIDNKQVGKLIVR